MKKSINIKGISISPPIALAPMVGLSHSALRSLAMNLGGVGLLYTEMLSAKRLPGDNAKISPFLIKTPIEKPLFYQIYTSDADDIEPAFNKIHQLDAQGIDLNLGCPAPKLRKQGAGGFLSQHPDKLKSVLTKMRESTELPLSVKIRLEYKDEKKFGDFCKLIEDCGVDLITVHAREPKEKFCRKPKWKEVAVAKRSVSIPVFANGGVFSVDDARKCMELSAADGLMLGRAAAVRPWLFRQIEGRLISGKQPKEVDANAVFFDFYKNLHDNFPKERQLGRLKQFTTLFAESFVFGHILATGVQRSNSMEEAKEKASQFFDRNSIEEIIND